MFMFLTSKRRWMKCLTEQSSNLPLKNFFYFYKKNILHFTQKVKYFYVKVFLGGIIRGYRIFFCPKAQSNSPSRKGGVLLRSAFARGATKGVGGRRKIPCFSSLPKKSPAKKKTYRRKRNKPLQSDDFSLLRLSVREKFLKWYQTHLEEGFYSAK